MARKTKKKAAPKKPAKKKTKAPAVHKDGWYRNDVGENNIMAFYVDGTVMREIPLSLFERARKKVGMTNEVIATYPDAKSLKEVCDKIHPKSNPDAYPKRGSAPKPVIYTEKVPDKIEIDSNMEAKFISRNRAQFDEQNLQAELRRINRKYGSQNPVKIVKTTTFNQVRGRNADRVACKVLVTHYEIYF